ncbi:ROK family protein [Arthrobacter zhaoxinii]|uniref:ROK family protein n=1 Tax=Arthrobacter zhaoxinii TaxID=2964616 RepID=UPI002103CCE4|nr:ROK family protein [Arthrobacter zhaoxinii]MCQ2002175.1 ROK family protein [Arthrobacter zhaoxinii]
MRHVIGLDLGGTKTSGGVVDGEGRILFSSTVATPAQAGPDAVLSAAADLTASLRADARDSGLAVDALGIGAAGVIDSGRGVVVSATDAIRGWGGTRLTAELTRRTGLPATAINDVHAHALGESWLGAGAGMPSVLFIGVGTGVGGSYVLDGECLEGSSFTAGHVGHIASPFAYETGTFGSGLPCSCGGTGHVEAVASGPGIFSLFTRLGGVQAEDTRGVYRLAAEGHPVAAEALRRGAAAAGSAVGGLANVLDPHAVIVGGGLAFAGPLWWNTMEQAARNELLRPLAGLPIVPAQLGETAAIRGAARRALALNPVSEGQHV